MLVSFVLPGYAQDQNGMSRLIKLLNKSQLKNGNDLAEGDPSSRTAFEYLRLQNPETGEIPIGIYERELAFFDDNLKKNNANARTASNLIQWRNRGPFNVGGRTRALAIDLSNEDVILAGGVSGGIWRSENGGNSWVKTTNSNELQSVTAIAQDPRVGHQNVWYYTTGEFSGNSASGPGAFFRGDGIYKSVDGGLTWTVLSSTFTGQPQVSNTFDINHEIVVSPIDGTVFLANWTGIYKSENGGINWTLSLGINGSDWTDVAIDSQGNVYAFHNEQGVSKSTNNGDTWTNISPDNFPTFFGSARGELAIAASNENIIYLLAEASTTIGYALWRYNGSNDSWQDRSSEIPQLGGSTGDFDSQGGYDLLIKVKPDDENFVIIGGTNLFRSTDGFASGGPGVDWIGGYTPENTSFGLYSSHHPDQHCIVFYPSNPNKAISGNDGGLQVTEDIRSQLDDTEPVAWTPLNNGYLTTQSYAVSIGQNETIMSGFQDNGTWRSNSLSSDEIWNSTFSGDGSYNAFNSNGTSAYVSAQNAIVYRITYSPSNLNSPTAFTEIFDGDGKSPLFISPFYIDTKNDNIFYQGGMSVLHVNTQSETGTITNGWKEIDLPGSSGRISEFGVIGNGSVYVGTSSGDLFKIVNVQNTMPTVTELDNSLFASSYISGIAVNESDANEILLTVSNYDVVSIFHSTDGGQSWTSVGGNLEENTNGSGGGPSVRCGRILGDGDLYIVATSVGLFTTKNLAGNNTIWEQEDLENLGAVVVEHLAVRNSDGLVVAGTHGNGVFSAKIATLNTDLSVTSIDSPSSGKLATENVVATVTNFGIDAVTSFELSYQVDNQLQQTETINANIFSGETYTHTFSTPFDFSAPDTYNIAVDVIFAQDENQANNSLAIEIDNFLILDDFPYTESFENGEAGWIGQGIWELGSPAQTNLNQASEGTNAWMTDLDANYTASLNDRLLSPVFDFSNIVNPVVKFDIKYSIEEDWDGVLFAYRTDLSANQFKIIGEASGLDNWYNKVADVFGRTAWTGSLSDFVEASADLDFLENESTVQFAFIFASDGFVDDEGFIIDNFQVTAEQAVATGDLLLSSTNVSENQSINTIVGELSIANAAVQDGVFALVNGIGDVDNASFTIVNNQLLTNEIFNYEIQKEYSIRIEGTKDQEAVSVNFIIDVDDENDPPTGLTLTNSTIEENNPQETVVGEIQVVDEDLDESYSFRFVSNADFPDNTSFRIFGNQLRSMVPFDHELKNTFSVKLEGRSSVNGATIEETFSIDVLDANDLPTGLVLSNNVVPSGESSGFAVGDFSAQDQDNDILAYDLTSGNGDDDNLSFTIIGTQLVTSDLTDFNTQELYRILVEASDGKGGFTVSPFEVTVEEVLGLINLAKLGISIFPNPVEEDLNIKIANQFYGEASVMITTLEGKLLMTKQINKAGFVQKDKLDLSQLSKGVYFITFDFDGKHTTGRLVKK